MFVYYINPLETYKTFQFCKHWKELQYYFQLKTREKRKDIETKKRSSFELLLVPRAGVEPAWK